MDGRGGDWETWKREGRWSARKKLIKLKNNVNIEKNKMIKTGLAGE